MALDENEIILIKMPLNNRINLNKQILNQIKNLGFDIDNYCKFALGIELSKDWPCDKKTEITLAQLIVLAKKFNMRITITELFMRPRKKKDEG